MRKLRIAAISYLNTAPLMWDFEHGDAGSHFEISYTLPSTCAQALASGVADIGIIPAAAYTQIPGLKIVPGVAIASRRAVRSILLVSKVPVAEIGSVAMDTSSMTSVALTQVLFEKWLGGARSYTAMAPDLEQMLQAHDAALLIGDPALQVDRSRYVTLDLAEEWIRRTGKPFVFAFWAIRADSMDRASPELDVPAIFQQSRTSGLRPENLDAIGKHWAPRLGLSQRAVREYLTSSIFYDLDAGCLEGLQLFYRYAAEVGALPPAPALAFVEGHAVSTAKVLAL